MKKISQDNHILQELQRVFMVVCIISSIPKVNHLSDMYTRGSQIAMNEKVQSSFKIQDGKLRIDRATVAFGMGVDCRIFKQFIMVLPI